MGLSFVKQKAPQEPVLEPEPFDIYRRGTLRYMGFGSVILGKIMPHPAAEIPKMAAAIYMCSDVFNKTQHAINNGEKPMNVAIITIDNLLWHLLGTVYAPLLLYGSVQKSLNFLLPVRLKTMKVGYTEGLLLKEFLSGFISLLLMPLCIEPMHDSVNFLMDNTYRRWIKHKFGKNKYINAEAIKRNRKIEKENLTREQKEARAKVEMNEKSNGKTSCE